MWMFVAVLSQSNGVMMKMLYKSALKIPEEKRTAEIKAMIETYGTKVDFVDFSKLEALCREI